MFVFRDFYVVPDNPEGCSKLQLLERFKISGSGLGNLRPMQKHTREIILTNTLTLFNAVNAVIIGLLYAALERTGDTRLLWDGLGVGISSVINTVMSIVQEYRAHQALEKISVHADLPVKVLRSNEITLASANTLLPNDIVRVVRGDVIPADGIVINAVACQIDTSMLTGESEPLSVLKGSSVSGGSFCTAGQADVQLTSDREHSLSGRIESHAQKLDLSPSPLQKNVNAIFIWSFGLAGLFACIDLLRDPSTMINDVESIRRAATLVLGLIPESLILLSTVTFIVGTIRIRKLGIIVQRLAALESFSQATDVCFDKTGTLTTNNLFVDTVLPLGITTATDANRIMGAVAAVLVDDSVLVRAIRAHLPQQEYRPVAEQTAFTSATKYSAVRFTSDAITYVFGAAEVVCTTDHPLWKEMHDVLRASGRELRRCIVLASSDDPARPCGVHTQPLCWVTFHDVLRDDARQTLVMFHEMGIATHVLTGDRMDTATAVVDQLQIESSLVPIHARCTPEDKYRIVDDLCKEGHVIMIGDGINDIPALRRADVGIAPSQSSTATKLVADIVLEEGGFADFPAMVDEGRTAVRTVQAVSTMFLIKNVLLILLTLSSWLFAAPYVLSPRRGALLSIIGIVIPSMCVTWWPLRGVATKQFFQELIIKVLAGSCGAIASYAFAQLLFAQHPQFDSIAVFSLLTSFLTTFVYQHRKHLLAYVSVSVGSLAVVALLMILPTSTPIISLIQSFYEVGNLGIGAFTALLTAAMGSFVASFTITASTCQLAKSNCS
jgi:cation-transporting ATPase E